MAKEKEYLNSPGDDFLSLMQIWNTIQVLGRNDVENSVGPRIIKQVQGGEITAREGRAQMQALLDAKQDH